MRKALTLSIPLLKCLLLLSGVADAQDFPVYKPLPAKKKAIIITPSQNNVRIENNNYIQSPAQQTTQKSDIELDEERLNRRLDDKNGFKDLQLNSDILSVMKIATITPLEQASYKGLKAYKLWNIANYDLIDQSIKSMVLEFQNDKLVSILIELPAYNAKTDLAMRNAIINEITNAYGKWSSMQLTTANIKENAALVLMIMGERVGLMACRYNINKSGSINDAMSRGDTFRFFNDEYAGYLLGTGTSGL